MSFLERAFHRRAPDPPTTEQRSSYSISDPRIVELFGGAPSLAGVSVTEQSVLGVSPVWRAVSLIAGSIATLPLHTIAQGAVGTSQRVPSFLDDPGKATGLTSHEWKRLVTVHLLLHGNAYLAHVYGGAGQLLGLQPIHPGAVGVEVDDQGRKTFKVSLNNGSTQTFNDQTLTHVMGLSLDGIRGLSPLQLARHGVFGTTIAADKSAASMFGNGPSVSLVVQPAPEAAINKEDAKELRDGLERGLTGPANAGRIGFISRNVQITPIKLTNEESQWLQSRAFQVEEVARWFGVPPHLLAQTEKQSSWGTGVAEQNRGLARYVLEPWSTCIQERLTWLLPGSLKVEFFYTAFVESDPETEIGLLLDQLNAGAITTNEFRRIRNLPPLAGGDVPKNADAPRVSQQEPE